MIDQWKHIEQVYLKSILYLIDLNLDISKKFIRKNNDKHKIGFNVFQIVSDTYYKENFHSYLIYNLLSQLYHDDGNKFLFSFIECINLISKYEINLEDFKNPIVDREKDQIDIRIRDFTSMKSIIIENKINDAIDQPRQIPRYYKNERNNGFEVVGIVYLSLIDGKKPDQSEWEIHEKEEINELLIYLNSSEYNKVNLIKDWIEKCILISNNIDVISTLRQYKEILKHLTSKEMNQEFVSLFYDQILEKEKYSSALSIRDMLVDLNEYRAMKIKEKFYYKGSLFNKISHFKWGGDYRAKFESPDLEYIDFWIDIVCIDKQTKIYLHEDSTFDKSKDKLKSILQYFDKFDGFTQISPNVYLRTFSFPEGEKDLYDFLEYIFENFKKLYELKF
ncbi:hypothetical protein [Chondrinema litorale]|uniref:hypothetical protein n=1 Tax=Chondrinema litorale TaxID=2994555 RepID=UPI0025431414|nr:hypothetical protein [Chondrinema litorale]UZR99846.1 hypothetical protein OQ292_38315 [Chondrinema litorale]